MMQRIMFNFALSILSNISGMIGGLKPAGSAFLVCCVTFRDQLHLAVVCSFTGLDRNKFSHTCPGELHSSRVFAHTGAGNFIDLHFVVTFGGTSACTGETSLWKTS